MSDEPIAARDAAAPTEFAEDERAGAVAGAGDADALIVNLDGYEGPLDMLLDLARRQKVDIRRISMVALVDQYLDFIAEAKKRSLELAADYLVMASWLAYLKSKLLIPSGDEAADEPTADEMAARLAFQLQRLAAMREALEALRRRPQEGFEIFIRGAPEGVRVTRRSEWQADIVDLLKAYAEQRIAKIDRDYKIAPPKAFSIEGARMRLERMLGSIPDWTELRALALAPEIDAPPSSQLASALNAALEFAKEGRLDLKQLAPFDPVYCKRRERENA